MEKEKYIKEGFENLASKFGPKVILTATVVSINDDDDTIKVALDSGLEIDDVRLKAVVKSGNKLVVYPEVQSEVLIASIENSSEFVVISVDEVESIQLKIGQLEVKIDESIRIVKGSDSLKDVFTLIIEAVQQIMVIYGNNPNYTKLTNALTKLNNIMD